MKPIVFLTVDDVLRFYEKAINLYGGMYGLRDLSLLESAVAHPQMISIYESDDIFEIAATYFVHIIKNHPFLDGNKRTGVIATISFLQENDYSIDYEFESLYDLAISVADSSLKKADVVKFLKQSKKQKKLNL